MSEEADGGASWLGDQAVEGTDARGCLTAARERWQRGEADAALRWLFAATDARPDLPTSLACSRLAGQVLPATTLPLRPARVAVVGTSTTAQLVELLPLAAARAGLAVQVWEAPYGQVQQQVLDPASGLYAFAPDVVLLAVHEGDADLPAVSADPAAAVDGEVRRWRSLWDTVRSRSGAQVLQFGFVVPADQPLGHYAGRLAGSRYRTLQELNLRLGAEAGPGVALLDVDRLAAARGKDAWSDPRYWHLAKQSVSLAHLPALARQTAGVLAAQLGTSRKAVVLDLDGTLWGGVVGEDGIDGLQLGEGPVGEAFAAFQDHLRALQERGVVLAVCSKNDEALVTEAFGRHPGMRLRLEDLAVVSAGWNDKPAQLRSIAESLGLGLEAFVFVDDNPVEREAVRRLVPEVDVLTLPADPAGYVRALVDYPFLETVSVTQEDVQRTEQYRARAQAEQLLRDAPSLDDYLRSLDMVATVVPADDSSLPRIAQLVGKTNQFNLTGRRRGVDALRELAHDRDALVLAVRLRDRFADHGLVGVMICLQRGSDLVLDTWLMSCRVIGRTLEHEMLRLAEQEAVRRGCARLVGTYVPSAKNGLVSDLFARLGFTGAEGAAADGASTWELAVPSGTGRAGPLIRVQQQHPTKESA